MSKIAAHATALSVAGGGGTCGIRVVIAELDPVMHIVAYCLHSRPSLRRMAEQRPRKLREFVSLAIPAAQKKHQHVIRQVLNWMLYSVWHDLIRRAGIADHEPGGNPQCTRRRYDT